MLIIRRYCFTYSVSTVCCCGMVVGRMGEEEVGFCWGMEVLKVEGGGGFFVVGNFRTVNGELPVNKVSIAVVRGATGAFCGFWDGDARLLSDLVC